MLLADRRDLRTIWDALGTDIGDLWGGFWSVLGVQQYEDDDGVVGFQPDLRYRLELQKGHEPEEDWAELEQVLDMSEDQFLATVADPSLLWS